MAGAPSLPLAAPVTDVALADSVNVTALVAAERLPGGGGTIPDAKAAVAVEEGLPEPEDAAGAGLAAQSEGCAVALAANTSTSPAWIGVSPVTREVV
jgi:hypothetical protein